jgi:hypothetical protein
MKVALCLLAAACAQMLHMLSRGMRTEGGVDTVPGSHARPNLYRAVGYGYAKNRRSSATFASSASAPS